MATIPPAAFAAEVITPVLQLLAIRLRAGPAVGDCNIATNPPTVPLPERAPVLKQLYIVQTALLSPRRAAIPPTIILVEVIVPVLEQREITVCAPIASPTIPPTYIPDASIAAAL